MMKIRSIALLFVMLVFITHECRSQNIDSAKFKVFTKEFFHATESGDTTFLKAHIIFPIYNSTFANLDASLIGSSIVNQKHLFKHLKILFPSDLIKRIDKEGIIEISDPNSGRKEYAISLYLNDNIEYDFVWSFIKKRNVFYFIRFKGEPG
jgi:hypothetical protein